MNVFQDFLANDPDAGVKYEAYFIPINFEDLADKGLRDRVENMPSRLSLPKDQVDDLRKAAGELLRQSPEFQKVAAEI